MATLGEWGKERNQQGVVQVNQSGEAQGGGIRAEVRVLLYASHLNCRYRKKGANPNAYRG